MTIKTFSDRTGLPTSTLRYYEKEGLLFPHIRAENGYRLYDEGQIPIAIKIHSLRQAGISLSEIRKYLASNETEQEQWLSKWRQDIDKKLSTLHVAKQFLYGIQPKDEHIRLVKWDESGHMLWFCHRVNRQLHPFAQVMEERTVFIKSLGIIHTPDVFVQQDKIEGRDIIGKVGFRLRGKLSLPKLLDQHDIEIEALEPTLFVTLECQSHDPYACFSHMLLLQSFGFEPAGPSLERYPLNDKSHYELMIPVVHESNYS